MSNQQIVKIVDAMNPEVAPEKKRRPAKLTVKTIEALKPGRKPRETPDGFVPGLYLVDRPTGSKSFVLRYRHDGRPRKLTIGGGDIGLADARKLAAAARAKVAGGGDPAAEKRAAKIATRAPVDDLDLIEKVVSSYVERYAKANTRERSWREAERILNKEIVGAWRGRHLSTIARAEIHELLDSIVDRGAPVAANRTLAVFRGMCSWALERGLIDASPCAAIKAPKVEEGRDRVLSDDELRMVWKACDAIGRPYGPLFRLLILTGQRLREVGQMRWSEVDLDAKVWTLPKERAKNKTEHTIPLSSTAVAILESVQRIKGSPFVFTVDGAVPVGSYDRAKDKIDKCVAGAAVKAAEPLPIMPPWVLHDFRRTAASNLARLGIAVHVVEAVLNHRSGTIKGVAKVYNRYDFAPEKAAAAEALARFVESVVSGAPANVVSLKAARADR
jgi:integrase